MPGLYISDSLIITDKYFKYGDLYFDNDPPGDIGRWLEYIYQKSGAEYPRFYKMDRLSQLIFLGAEYLLKGWAHLPDKSRTGVILANSHSSLDTDVRYMRSVETIASPALFVYTLPNIGIGEISIRHGLKGENSFFIQKEFDAKFFNDYIPLAFESGFLDYSICGWADIFGEECKAFLYLVAPGDGGNGLIHNTENIEKLYYA